MSLITDKPENLPSGNDLDSIPDDLLETPPAYLSFGGSPAALDDPPCVGEVRTYIVKARCTGEHGPIERKDGEMRYTRTLSIIAAWESGKRPPPVDEPQPGLFDAAGEPAIDPESDERFDGGPDFSDGLECVNNRSVPNERNE